MTDARRALTNVPLVLGVLGVLAIGLIALFGPQVAPGDPQAQRVILFYPDGRFAAPPTPPDELFVLGTDPLGRDQASRLLWGARLTLGATLLGLAGRLALGLLVGVLAGWRRGRVETALTWLTNAVAGFPQLMLALLIAVALREHGFIGFVVALASVGWAELAQFIRGEVIRVRASAYVDAARALGSNGLAILRTHVLRSLAPQLAGVLALEAGSVLLLLAELGFIGLFISGGAAYLSDEGGPILPIRDRAPEWGQMLAGARHYAFSHQYVAFIPGVVVVCAVFAFNLFGEGLRAASDPFGTKRLSPRALGALSRGLGAIALVGVVGYGVVAARSGEIAFNDAMRQARAAAARIDPDLRLVAGVVRFRASRHALEKPEKLNFYFREPGEVTITRVGFVDADPNAMEVKPFDEEDDLPFEDYVPIDEEAGIAWERALQEAEERGGRGYRAGNQGWTARVVLAQEQGDPLTFTTVYERRQLGTAVLPGPRIPVNALTGEVRIAEDPARLASRALGGPVVLSHAFVAWRWAPQAAPGTAPGIERPASASYSYYRADQPGDARQARVVLDLTRESGAPTVSVVTQGLRPRAFPEQVSVFRAFQLAESAGGRELRQGWERERRAWRASAVVLVSPDGTTVNVSYSTEDGTGHATFSYDPRTNTVRRL